MAEFAWSPFETVGSLLPDYTRNPYALDRVPAGSSGGTAAAVAANFGAVGLGTDTGDSIRGPSSHTSLAGIRSTMGLTSRAGIVPLFLNRDIGGPMAMTVADAVAVFDVVAGYDPADPVTSASEGKRPDSYLKSLDKDGLRGARIGALRQLFGETDTDPGVLHLMEQALVDMCHHCIVHGDVFKGAVDHHHHDGATEQCPNSAEAAQQAARLYHFTVTTSVPNKSVLPDESLVPV
jgi:Asp-tRNA(Asn)/Glu-tRNA(Gln) amidotransferase A subunit family amidase